MAAESLSILAKKIEEQQGAHWLSWLWRLMILALVAWFQPDGVTATLTVWGWSFELILFSLIIYANLQLVYYYFFWGWIAKEVAKKAVKAVVRNEEFKKDVEFAKELTKELTVELTEELTSELAAKRVRIKFTYYLERAKVYIIGRFHEFTEKENRFIKVVKEGSLLSITGLAASPIPGSRSVPVVILGAFNMRQGLFALMIGNSIRIFYMVGLWSVLKTVLGPNFKWAVASFFIISISVFAIKLMPPKAFGKFLIKKYLVVDEYFESRLLEMNKERSL